MAIKRILVAYSGHTGGSGAIRLSLQLAQKYDAHVTGLVSHGPTYMERRYNRLMNRDILQVIRDRDDEIINGIRERFEEVTASFSPNISIDFMDLRTNEAFSLARSAHAYDIVIMGRRAALAGEEHFGQSPDDVALHSGRPVILVPTSYDDEEPGKRALVAWDGKRAAARAVGDSMDILKCKSLVTVLSVSDTDLPEPDIMVLLRQHGVNAEYRVRPPEGRSISTIILETCREVKADLLVMGAYEHSRTFEQFFGGVTNDILEDAHLPVLLSH